MIVLGISGLYHDSAAALLENGKIIAAAQEERFTRIKNDAGFPCRAIGYCLNVKNMQLGDVDAVVYYDNPVLTLDRFVKNASFCGSDVNDLLKFQYDSIFQQRMMVHKTLQKQFGKIGKEGRLLVSSHHKSHAASAFYASPFEEAAILTVDGVGEWNTTTIGYGKGAKIEIKKHIDYPHSLGMLYSAFTYFCGFKVNSGEYKLMGLAPYGKPVYYNTIMENLVDVKPDGSFRLNLDYFDFQYGRTMVKEKFGKLFHVPRRMPEYAIGKEYMDLAASIQKVTEDIMIKLADTSCKLCGTRNLVLAGGTALNCVANAKILTEGAAGHLWIQPAAGDAGGAIGAAFLGYYEYLGGNRPQNRKPYNTYLGPEYSDGEIRAFLRRNGIPAISIKENRAEKIADLLTKGKVVGLFQGRMEMGPRALGNRSILASAVEQTMQSKLNLKIKFRESFRPFAPSVTEEAASDYFDLKMESPYMLLCVPVRKELRTDFDIDKALRESGGNMADVVSRKRSSIPAVTHVDFSARIQTVTREMNRRYYDILKAYGEKTGIPVLCNTSFNVRGEPIVCNPEDAYACFMRTDMDALVLEDYLLMKEGQPKWREEGNWRDRYELD